MPVLASDDFDRTNASTLGANWGQISGTDTNFGILSNQADVNTGWNGNQYTAISWPDNQYSQATLVENVTHLVGVCVRCDPTLAANTFYAAGQDALDHGGASTVSRIFRYVAGTPETLATGATPLAAGQVLRLEAEGTILRMYINDVLEVSTTDANITSGDPGITGFHTSSDIAVFNDWSGGDFLGTASVTGTVSSAATETDIVAGGKTLIVTLDGDAFVPEISTSEIVFVSSVLASNATSIAFTLTLPSTVANDILLMEYCHRSTTAGSMHGNISSGWTSFHSQLFSGLSTFSGKAYWHRASSDYFGLSTGISSLINSAAGICTVYRGVVSTISPVSGSASTIGEYNTVGNETQAQISTVVPGTMVCFTVVNSPDFAISAQSTVVLGSLTERAELLNTGGTDTSITHASKLFPTTGTTSTFTWAQTNASSGSWAYALYPQTTAAFDPQRQNFINGISSAQTEGTGWNAVVVAGQNVTGVVRTSDTVVTLTLDAFGSYDITAQETMTVSVPSGILLSGASLLATPTFTVDPAGGAAAQTFTVFNVLLSGRGYGGIFPGGRI